VILNKAQSANSLPTFCDWRVIFDEGLQVASEQWYSTLFVRNPQM
jgi:hypothetical protein